MFLLKSTAVVNIVTNIDFITFLWFRCSECSWGCGLVESSFILGVVCLLLADFSVYNHAAV